MSNIWPRQLTSSRGRSVKRNEKQLLLFHIKGAGRPGQRSRGRGGNVTMWPKCRRMCAATELRSVKGSFHWGPDKWNLMTKQKRSTLEDFHLPQRLFMAWWLNHRLCDFNCLELNVCEPVKEKRVLQSKTRAFNFKLTVIISCVFHAVCLLLTVYQR